MTNLEKLSHSSLEEKAALIQQFYENVIFHESGIMYSMMKIDGDTVRPYSSEDFIGMETCDLNKWKIKPEGYWEVLNNENSITASGIYLASQVYRYQATGSEEALVQAGKAFQSLHLIYQLGERDGRPGWMGKPYGFRLSDQTSGDQYLDATWGLFLYHKIAMAAHKSRIEEMLIGFADYWRNIDYKIYYFNNYWDNKTDSHAYNAIFIMINMVAYWLTKDQVYLEEAQFLMNQAKWHEETALDVWKREHLNGQDIQWAFDKLVEGHLKPGEFLCWEYIIHCKFVAVAAEIIHLIKPDFIEDKISSALETYWSTWHYGMTEDFLPFYFYIVDVKRDTWHPAPLTARLPREEWPINDPSLSYASQIRWTEPLARFMYTSVIAAKYADRIADEAKDLALKIMEHTDEIRLRWMYDPDGKQWIPELTYYNNALSSEMPATYLATFWRGRLEKLW